MCNAQHLVLALLSTLDLLAQHLVLALLSTLDLLAQHLVLALLATLDLLAQQSVLAIAELTHVTTFVKCINDHYCWSSKLIILISSVC